MSLYMKGVGVSRGIAMGKAYLLRRGQPEISEYAIPKKNIEDEVARFKDAVRKARQQLQSIRKAIPRHTPTDITTFIDTHLLMLEDTTLCAAPIDIIRQRQCNSEWALKLQRDALAKVFDEMDDPYLRTRKDDVDHVVSRIQRILLNMSDQHGDGAERRLKGHIVLADDLTPADTVLMLHQGIAGFVTEYGGPTSHTAILARGLGIPAIVGLRHVQRYVQDEEPLIVDGRNGVVIAGADNLARQHYRKLQKEEKLYRTELTKLKGKPAVSRDGVSIRLYANIELPEDVIAVKRIAAEGIGLYRTEFLYMNRPDIPGEEEQFKEYVRVVNTMKGAPVTIRTLDLGADKQVDGGASDRRICANPALGLRAVRLCLRDPGLFYPQLRAILRAAAYGPVRMMIPMLCNTNELFQVQEMIDEAKRELERQGLKYNPDVPVGGMIEIPAAALSADAFARQLDFLSIGTNDLIQYTLAIDRIDDEVSYLYDPLHPAVLQLVERTIKAGNKAGIPVAMCGEMAGDIRYTRLLLGLGLREFSMHPATLLEVKRIINNSDVRALDKSAKRILKRSSPVEIRALVDEINSSH